MKIFLGADHNGFYLKKDINDYLAKHGYKVTDDGDLKLDPMDDYPVFAQKVVNEVLASDDEDPRGILVCGSGQGMMMAANRFKGIRACLGWDIEAVRASRNDEDSNILCIPSRVLKDKDAFHIITSWLDTPFAKAPRYIRRLKELDRMN
jgi:ribose 5-phosphate isomerase B